MSTGYLAIRATGQRALGALRHRLREGHRADLRAPGTAPQRGG